MHESNLKNVDGLKNNKKLKQGSGKQYKTTTIIIIKKKFILSRCEIDRDDDYQSSPTDSKEHFVGCRVLVNVDRFYQASLLAGLFNLAFGRSGNNLSIVTLHDIVENEMVMTDTLGCGGKKKKKKRGK
jgi:hypothetical protein